MTFRQWLYKLPVQGPDHSIQGRTLLRNSPWGWKRPPCLPCGLRTPSYIPVSCLLHCLGLFPMYFVCVCALSLSQYLLPRKKTTNHNHFRIRRKQRPIKIKLISEFHLRDSNWEELTFLIFMFWHQHKRLKAWLSMHWYYVCINFSISEWIKTILKFLMSGEPCPSLSLVMLFYFSYP